MAVNISNLNLLREYLQKDKEVYGRIGLGVSLSKSISGNITVYGLFDNKLIVSDSNSIYVLKEKYKLEKILRLPILRKKLKINNSKIWYQDIKKITKSKIPITNPCLKKLNSE